MTWVETLQSNVNDILNTSFAVRDGRVVPETGDVVGNQAVKLDAAFLYADLAGSARIAAACPWDTTAKIIRAYLYCATRLIRAWGGHVRSFDGDRVMGVFIGADKETHATRCAREIFYSTSKIIEPTAKQKFKSVRESGVPIRQACGVDVGECRAVRAGIRDNADLIWIGRAPSLAAKLSDCREYPYCTFITSRVYNAMADTKVVNGEPIWERRTYQFGTTSETVYRSSWWKTP
jgi:class 3 adenylate cyclase